VFVAKCNKKEKEITESRDSSMVGEKEKEEKTTTEKQRSVKIK